MPRPSSAAKRGAATARRGQALLQRESELILTAASKNPMFIQHWLLPNKT